MKKILFVLGTARTGRKSELAASYVLSVVKSRTDVDPVFVDVRDFPTSRTGELSQDLSEKWDVLVREASGMVIISPEYNHGYPGELKLLLDSAYKAYAGRPAAICAVSDGPIGGARMAEQLKLVLSAFQMIVINAAVYFANVNELFDSNGGIKNREFWEKRVHGMLDQLLTYAK